MSLRIFYAAGASPNAYQLSQSRLWRTNLYDSLVAMGHDVIEFTKDVCWHQATYTKVGRDAEQAARFAQYRSDIETALIAELTREHARKSIDVLFTYFWRDMCRPEVIRRVRDLGILTVNWFCNASYQFELVEDLAPAYDYCLVPEAYRLEDYKRIGARPIYCQEAANPSVYKPYRVAEDVDVAFVGQSYGERLNLMTIMHSAGVPVHAFGPGWREAVDSATSLRARAVETVRHPRGTLRALASRVPARYRARLGLRPTLPAANRHDPLSDEDVVRMASRAKVSLGFGACAAPDTTGARVYQIRLRDFEMPMSGACYLAEYNEEYANFFEPDVEVAMYRSVDELIDKAKRLVRDEHMRRTLRERARSRALAEHTWQHRFRAAFREMGLER